MEKPDDEKEKKEGDEWKEKAKTEPEPNNAGGLENILERLGSLEEQFKSLATAQPPAAQALPPEPKVERVESLEVKATPAPKVEPPAEMANLPHKRKRKKLRLW
jgi:hypothetical protein